MYSRWTPPPCVGKITLKQPQRTTPNAWQCGDLACDKAGDTWFVWQRSTGIVEAIFYAEPNVHGWSASEAHAKSYLNRASPVNPFELDSVP